ncbi:glycosyltransferase [Kaustia mangrovi]|uniref:Glycosyltransferase n=1 Tax=Kaustia mangrovi TaxID=2593653 RepID=A0A7S8HCI9_9HYPH|nr:glycosyltransferase family 2 protein [Kaustia mangrovi]QPC43681.1 glycosyltransferase [Kaustia mangrovi]
MKISVLTVTWNSAATVRHTLDSFFAQSHEDKELVVIDGASRDDTVEIVKSYPRDAIRLVCEPDEGMYDALNKALALHGGDAVGVLNSDDAYHDAHVLSRIASALREADIVHGHLRFVSDHATKRVVRRWQATPRPARGFRTGWMPAHPTFYVRREVAERVGPFDCTLATAADYDWMLRAVELHGYRTAMVDRVMVDMQAGGRSTASLGAHIRHNLEALRSRRRWLRSGAVDYALLAKPARKLGQFVRPRSAPGRPA